MDGLELLIKQLESGATSLVQCLSDNPHLSHQQQLSLALVDQQIRFKQNLPADVGHYLFIIHWLADDSDSQRRLVLADFQHQLGAIPTNELLSQFRSRYGQLDEEFPKALEEVCNRWNQAPIDDEAFDLFCDQFEEQFLAGVAPPIEQWLERVPEISRLRTLRQLLEIEVHHLRQQGKSISWDQYRVRFSPHTGIIDRVEGIVKESQVIDPNSETSPHALPLASPAKIPSHPAAPRQKSGKIFGERYRVIEPLGQGGFGLVYRASDNQLQRDVAVKVMLKEGIDASSRKRFLDEARIVARLDHPNIVPVFDVGQTEEGNFYIVSKLIEGSNLKERISRERLDRTLSLRIIEQMADALQYAHAKGLIHRDIKPANILLDRSDKPFLTDFGLALRESEDRVEGQVAGTPAYMSPEQASGLGSRVNQQSDIYSLGVVLFELLTGRRPFTAENKENLIRAIKKRDVPSPRVFEESISKDLERICLKALARRASDRFIVARDFANEIRGLLEQPISPPASQSSAKDPAVSLGLPQQPSTFTSTPRNADITPQDSDSGKTVPPRVVPKGLRSFDASDAGFFLELLPGPWDREGLPEALRFWKTRIEETDVEKTFQVGLIYGPSGCGKSSLMKAGLLPRLGPKILSVYIEAAANETEARLLRGVRKAVPDAEGDSLKEVLNTIRRRQLVPTGGKLLLVIDQFEQWLFAETNYAESSLTEALLECDGAIVQAIVMVREDFWVSVSRFLAELDIPIVERGNSAMVDLFSLEHATKVLGLFGKAYEKLPENAGQWTLDQQEFIRQAIHGLSQDRKVISVRIAVLADMMRNRDWSTSALREVGGIEGVGVTFLEEMFGSRHSPIAHRKHQEAVQGTLAALLPAIGTDIKGSMQSAEALQAAAGYQDKPTQFEELLGILDKNLRLITPVDEEIEEEKPTSQSYQLAHDYMVKPLRQWLTQKQRETKRGRAELKLAERADVWTVNQENRQLPSLVEWFQILYWTDRKRWTAREQSLMRRAARVHARNWSSSILSVLILGGIIGYLFQQQSLRSQQEKITIALDSLQKTLGPAVPVNIEKLIEMKRPNLIRPDLANRFTAASEPREKLSLAFALAHFGQVEADYLISQLDDIEDRDTANLIDSLGHDAVGSIEKMRQAANECSTPELQRRKAHLALAALALGDTTLPIDACEFEGRPDPGVRTWFIEEFRRWELDLEKVTATVKDSSSPALRSAVCLGLGQIPAKQISNDDKNRIAKLATKWYSLPDSSTHSAVAWLMREWEIPEPTLPDAIQMVNDRNWFVNSQGVTLVRITPPVVELKPLPALMVDIRQYLAELESKTPEDKSQPENRYEIARTLYRLGEWDAALAEFDALRSMATTEQTKEYSHDQMLNLRMYALARLMRVEEADAALADWKARGGKYADYVESVMPLWLGRKEEAVQRLEVALARGDDNDRDALFDRACATALFASSDSMTEDEKRLWRDRAVDLLKRWTRDNVSTREEIRTNVDLVALYDDPRFVKLASEPEGPDRPYWLANREVTRGEYEAFLDDSSFDGEKPEDAKEARPDDAVSPTPDHPAQRMSWVDAVMYCNWLSRREGRTPAYRSVGKEKIEDNNDRKIEVDKWEEVVGATGYRLPRELEWEYACRAGSDTEWSPGRDEALLAAYCQMYPSTLASPSGKKLPNAWGLHDMHGNLWEWCWDLADSQGSRRVLRGGSWGVEAASCRPAIRVRRSPSDRGNYYGFRVALSSPAGTPK
jgi:serine/threonine protein kinase